MLDQFDSTDDYVMVGGGLAGSAVAARLSEYPAARVVMIEAGNENRYEQLRDAKIRRRIGFSSGCDTTPEPATREHLPV
jgi:choline dehydrogenase-like flavoprotein